MIVNGSESWSKCLIYLYKLNLNTYKSGLILLLAYYNYYLLINKNHILIVIHYT